MMTDTAETPAADAAPATKGKGAPATAPAPTPTPAPAVEEAVEEAAPEAAEAAPAAPAEHTLADFCASKADEVGHALMNGFYRIHLAAGRIKASEEEWLSSLEKFAGTHVA